MPQNNDQIPLSNAVRAFLDKHDKCEVPMNELASFAANHGHCYTGPSYAPELRDLRRAHAVSSRDGMGIAACMERIKQLEKVIEDVSATGWGIPMKQFRSNGEIIKEESGNDQFFSADAIGAEWERRRDILNSALGTVKV